MKRKVPVKMCLYLIVFTAFILFSGYGAQAATISASADARVRLGNDVNYGDEQQATVGTDSGSAVNRLYVGFSVPALPAGYEFASATLYGFYNWDTWDSTDREFSWHQVAEADDVWNEMAITGNNAPDYSGAAIATWTPQGTSSGSSGHAYNAWQSWDVTAALTGDTDGVLTLVFKQTDETLKGGYETFYTREKTPAGTYSFYIDYTTRQIQVPPTPTPEPATLTILGLSFFGLAGLRRRFSR